MKEEMELLTQSGFIRKFYQQVRENPDITQENAYEEVEMIYMKHFGRRKYSNFDSFRRIKRRFLNKR
jgi:hypothetical protein